MLLLGRFCAFVSVPILYVLLGWLNWDLAVRLVLLGATAVLAMSAWTTRHGCETKARKGLVLFTYACFLAMFGFHAFLRDFFGVQPDDNNVMDALFSSDKSEATEFLRHYFRPLVKHVLITLLALAGFACVIWWKPPANLRTPAPSRPPGTWIPALAFAVVFLLLHLSPTIRHQNPLLYFPVRYSRWRQRVDHLLELQARMAAANSDPGLASLRCTDQNPRTVVLVLGESVTRFNLPISDYPRQTTPELTSMGSELTWIPDVLSSAASTGASVERMLTPATLGQPDLWLSKPDVLLMARKAGYKTFWLSNQSTDSNGRIAVFASHAEKCFLANKGGSRGEGSYDEVLLPSLDLALRDPVPRKFIILHLLNAHPAYYYRYPKAFAKFNNADDAVTKALQAAGRKFWAINMRNYYDNSLLYMDHVLKRSLDLCRTSGQRLAWIFVPDHGQDAAHNSNYSGHNARARTQYEILMIFWRSPSFPAPAVEPAVLSDRPYQTDLFDHTLLGLLAISCDYYDPRADIFSEKFETVPRTINGTPYP